MRNHQSVNTFANYFSQVNFNIIFPSTPTSFQVIFFPAAVPRYGRIYCFMYANYMIHQPHYSRDPNYGLDDRGSIPDRAKFLLFAIMISRLALKYLYSGNRWFSSPTVKRPERETDHPLSHTKLKMLWNL
jgi:hypothetical protein